MIPLKDNIPTDRFPVITIALIVINIAVFGWQLSLSGDPGSGDLAAVGVSERDAASFEYGAVPARITSPGEQCAIAVVPARPSEANVSVDGQPAAYEFRCGSEQEIEEPGAGVIAFAVVDGAFWLLTLLTSMFMHGGVLHIAGNMLFLWVFGNNVEDSMGRLRFVAFYLLAGLVAVYAQAALDPDSTIPTIGASGAVAGVLGAYALLHPHARVVSIVFIVFFFTLVEIPAAILLGAWFLLQFLPVAGQLATPEIGSEGGGIAYLAHVGGFIFGLIAINLFRRRSEPPPGPAYPLL